MTFSIDTARQMAALAQDAYSPKEGVNNCIAIGPHEHVSLYLRNEQPVFAFRGSYSVEDRLTDLEAVLDHGQRSVFLFGGAVHLGMFNLLDTLLGWVLDWSERRRSGPIHVTGHSLGGALACLASKVLQKKGYCVGDVYTFGSPRCLTRGAAKVAVPQHRIVNDLDIVPHLPLACLYRHAENPILLSNGLIHEDGTWTYWGRSILRQLWKAPLLQVKDHLLSTYIEALNK